MTICVKPTTYKKNGKTIRRRGFCYKGRREAGQGGGKYFRVRVINPPSTKKKICRTDDVGREGHTKRIACVYTDGWKTQAWLLGKNDYRVVAGKLKPKNQRAANMLQTIKDRYGAIHRKKGGGIDEFSTQ